MRAKSEHVQVYLDSAQEWRWRFKAANHKVLADSSEGYQNESDLFTALEQVMGGYYQTVGISDDGEQSYVLGVIIRNNHALPVESPS